MSTCYFKFRLNSIDQSMQRIRIDSREIGFALRHANSLDCLRLDIVEVVAAKLQRMLIVLFGPVG